MNTYYVDSNATGANDGSSWADAWTSVESADDVAAGGDDVLIASDHVENKSSGSLTLNFAGTLTNLVRLISTDKSDDSAAAGARVNVLGTDWQVSLRGKFYAYGVTFHSLGDDVLPLDGAGAYQIYENCTLKSPEDLYFASFETNVFGRLINCTIDRLTGANSILARGDGVVLEFIGCTFPNTGNRTSNVFDLHSGDAGVFVSFVDCDLTDEHTTLFKSPGSSSVHFVHMQRCKLPAGYTLLAATPGHPAQRYLLEYCSAGTLSAVPLSLTELATAAGTISSTLSAYRSGGATDGHQANPYSWSMATNANAVPRFTALESPPLVRWVQAAADQTLTVRLASSTTLTDADVWMEVSSPNETASPNTTAQGNWQTTRAVPQATPATLTADSLSTWNGSGVDNAYKIEATISPKLAGPVTVRVFVGKPSATVYVDPQIGLS